MNLEKMAADIRANYSLYGNAHLEILEARETFKVRMALGPETENHLKMMHAAYLFAGGEFLGGLVPMVHLARPEKFQPVVRDLKIEFKAPAFSSVTAETRFSQTQADEMNATLDTEGRFDFTLLAELKDDTEKLVARTTTNYVIRNFLGG
ncbi:MAG: PaaI family thioesterase [Parvibaculales bacterium]